MNRIELISNEKWLSLVIMVTDYTHIINTSEVLNNIPDDIFGMVLINGFEILEFKKWLHEFINAKV